MNLWFRMLALFWRMRRAERVDIADERVCARAYVQGLLRGPDGNVAPAAILETVGAAGREPPADPPPMAGPNAS